MNKKIIMGSLLAVFMLMILPSISAVESNIVVEIKKPSILKRIQNLDFEDINDTFKDRVLPQTIEGELLKILYRILLVILSFLSFGS